MLHRILGQAQVRRVCCRSQIQSDVRATRCRSGLRPGLNPKVATATGEIKTFLGFCQLLEPLSHLSVRRSFKTASSAAQLNPSSLPPSSDNPATPAAGTATDSVSITTEPYSIDSNDPVPPYSVTLDPLIDEGLQLALESFMVALQVNLGKEELPQLPHIHDQEILKQVFTHRSVHSRTRNLFEEPEGDPAPDNEMLEHQGDSVLNFIITELILSLHPSLRVGSATKIRSLVVGNATLADISVRYGLPKSLRFHPAQAITLLTSMHIQADVFEAYVGGLYRDQGLEVVRDWLRAIFKPYVEEAYRICLKQHTPNSPPPSPTLPGHDNGNGHGEPLSSNPIPVGHLSLFNQYAQQKRLRVEWIFEPLKPEGSKMVLLWSVHAHVDGKLLATGRGTTKKAAQNEAARECLVQLGISFTMD